jgi:hypothetical protein
VDEERSEVVVPGVANPFTFDCVFDGGTSQQKVYESCAADVVAGCLTGFNGN